MCKIYYPFFRLETSGYKDKKLNKYNHKLYLNVLALFCDRILIPTWHLLEIDNDKFDILREYKDFFEQQIIYSRIPEHMSTLEEYYNYVKEKEGDSFPSSIDIRVTRIIELYEGITTFDKYKGADEQLYYSQKMKVFLQQYKKKHPQVKGFNLLLDLWQSNTTVVSKEEFEPVLLEKLKNNEISRKSYKRIKIASDELYFLAGASVQIMKVCNTEYFNDEKTQEILEGLITNLKEIINTQYDPENIVNLLKKLKVIQKAEELEMLDPKEIIKIRKQDCFKKFIEHYDSYASSRQFDEAFEKKKNSFQLICRIKSLIVSGSISIISTIISAINATGIMYSLIISLIFMFITYILTYIWQTKNNYEIPLLEHLLDKIIGFFDADALYLAKLHWITRKKSVS